MTPRTLRLIKSKANAIRAANYEQNLEWLKDCDLVIEAISERMDWKADLYRKVAPRIGEAPLNREDWM